MKELKNIAKDFIKEEDGLGIVELVLIIIVLIALVVIFKDKVAAFVGKLFEKADNSVDSKDAYQ